MKTILDKMNQHKFPRDLIEVKVENCISGNHVKPCNARNIFGSEMYFCHHIDDTALVKLFLIAICSIAAVLEFADSIQLTYLFLG
jgi:hypothetical protein